MPWTGTVVLDADKTNVGTAWQRQDPESETWSDESPASETWTTQYAETVTWG